MPYDQFTCHRKIIYSTCRFVNIIVRFVENSHIRKKYYLILVKRNDLLFNGEKSCYVINTLFAPFWQGLFREEGQGEEYASWAEFNAINGL